ncbi:hypothetical protein OC71_25445 [Pseudomonas sp. W15Feb9B]|nr:hypothetical protein OC71_25445 [Pseudomonas sp. W15Feb9B]
MVRWRMLLQDREALLAKPGAHHKALLSEAHDLHRARVIDSVDLCDFLELADAALAFAMETLHDIKNEG